MQRFRLHRVLNGFAWAACIVVATSVSLGAAPRGEFNQADKAIIDEKWPDALEAPSGIRYVILKEGDGPRPRQRQRVSVLYRGTFLDGREFSAVEDRENPFVFTLGSGAVILGWEVVLSEMQVGERRLLIIPFALGYGLRGRPPDIPNRTTLVFEVELLKIE